MNKNVIINEAFKEYRKKAQLQNIGLCKLNSFKHMSHIISMIVFVVNQTDCSIHGKLLGEALFDKHHQRKSLSLDSLCVLYPQIFCFHQSICDYQSFLLMGERSTPSSYFIFDCFYAFCKKAPRNVSRFLSYDTVLRFIHLLNEYMTYAYVEHQDPVALGSWLASYYFNRGEQQDVSLSYSEMLVYEYLADCCKSNKILSYDKTLFA